MYQNEIILKFRGLNKDNFEFSFKRIKSLRDKIIDFDNMYEGTIKKE